MNEIRYSYYPTDCNIHGFKIEITKNGEEIISDDKTASYKSSILTFDEVFNELYEIWIKRIKMKKYTREAFEFERNAGERLVEQTEKILDMSWTPKGYSNFKVFNPERIISAPYYEDRIVEAWLTEKFIKPYVERYVHKNNVACQTGKGPPVAQQYLKKKLKELYVLYGNDFYFLQCDVKGYYDNVSHDVIKEQFKGMQALGYKLFCNIIDDWIQTDGYAAINDNMHSYGIPKGNLPSQWIGIMYLNDVDWYISQRKDCLGFVRYMDDFIVFFKDKHSCKDCKIKIEKYLNENEMGIKLHPKKTVYASISRGFTFCGFHYRIRENGTIEMHIRQDKKKRIKKKHKKACKDYCNGNLDISYIKSSNNGTYAFLKQGTNRGLIKYLSYKYRYSHDKKRCVVNTSPKPKNANQTKEEKSYEKAKQEKANK